MQVLQQLRGMATRTFPGISPEVLHAIALGILFPILLYLLNQLKDYLRHSWYLSKIPSVKGGLPFFGMVFEMLKGSPWDTMSQWVLKYGKIYKFSLFGSNAVVVADPELLKVVLKDEFRTFKKDLEWTYQPFLVILGNGLVTADGKDWERQRQLLVHFLLVDILEVIPDMAIRAVSRLSKKLDRAKIDGTIIEMAEEFRNLTLQVIAEAVLSLSPEESDETFARMYLPIVEESNLRTWHPERMYIPGPAMYKFNRDVKRLNDYVTSLIVRRWDLKQLEKQKGNSSRRQDVLDKSLDAIPSEAWGPNIIRQIRDEVKTFILAGHETSASMLTWSLYEIFCPHNMDILAKFREEGTHSFTLSHPLTYSCNFTGRIIYNGHCSIVNGRSIVTSLPSKNVLDNLKYTENCLLESLRKYSNVPTVVRKAVQDVKLGDYFIPKGATIMVNMQGVHHNPEFWPEPMVYNPERHLCVYKPFTFLPFIDGNRKCLGHLLSRLESKVVLSMLVQNYDFQIMNPDEAGLKHAYMIPIVPKNGHHMKIL